MEFHVWLGHVIQYVLIFAIPGAVVAFIARRKGYDWATWVVFGTLVFPVAVVMVFRGPARPPEMRAKPPDPAWLPDAIRGSLYHGPRG